MKSNSKASERTKSKSGTTKKKKESELEIDGPHIFDILQEKVAKNVIPSNKVEKALLLNYTVAILKPNLISKSKTCRVVIDKIEKNNFEIFNFKHKVLTNEEIGNLYYKHVNKDYYQTIVDYMSSGPSAILVLINKDETYKDENGVEIQYNSPIQRWKDMIGYKDPTQTKGHNPEGLRIVYGTDIIRNEFWGSDNPSDAYRELSCFMMPLPSKSPEFTYDPNKLNKDVIMNFLFPLKPNHPDVSGRLDILAKYGPVLNYHVLDICVCKSCRPNIKAILKEEGKTLKVSKDKILDDKFIHEHSTAFCHECYSHFNSWAHLFSGYERTHIMTNEEIDFLILEMNKVDLLQILQAEKGSSAETVLTKFDIKKPPCEIQYTRKHIEKLISSVDVDYYDRYDFVHLQNLILEDRRIRLNFWVSTMISKPLHSFPNPKLINLQDSSQLKDIHDMGNKNFTLLRTNPVKVEDEEENKLKATVIKHPMFLKEKLSDHEINRKVEKLLSNNVFQVSTLEGMQNKNIVSNMVLLRNYELETLKFNKQNKILKEELEKSKHARK